MFSKCVFCVYISDFTWKYEVLTFPLGISIAATPEYFTILDLSILFFSL